MFYKVKKLHKIPQTRIGKRPIYKFFIDYDDGTGISKQFPVRAMLDLGSTSFTISPETAKVFKIPVVRRKHAIGAKDFGGNKVNLPGLYTIPLGLAFGNHRSLETFEVVKMQESYDVLIPAWYLEKHKAQGTTYGHLHFTECGQQMLRTWQTTSRMENHLRRQNSFSKRCNCHWISNSQQQQNN